MSVVAHLDVRPLHETPQMNGRQTMQTPPDWPPHFDTRPSQNAPSQFPSGPGNLISPSSQQSHEETLSLKLTNSADCAVPSECSKQLALDTYFSRCHNQPYALFHEQNFRHEFAQGTLPEYLVLSLLVATLRFSLDPAYQGDSAVATKRFASRAWKLILFQCFDSEEGPNHHVVQAIIILAHDEFTGTVIRSDARQGLTNTVCNRRPAWLKINMAASVAQSLQMMVEPSQSLDYATREEHRRTLWSIFLLDKLATVGRGRPAIFQDHQMRLQLPCTEYAFCHSSPATTPTFDCFTEALSPEFQNLSPMATALVLVATLSRVANFALEPDTATVQRNPWDHESGYTVLLARLTAFATSFEDESPFQDTTSDIYSLTWRIYSHVLYHLCHCLLQHPFLLRQQFRASNSKIPTNFLSHAIHTNWQHAQKLTYILAYAKESKLPVFGSFYGYCTMVAGTINALHIRSEDETLQKMSGSAAQANLLFLQDHSKYYMNSAKMALALAGFIPQAGRFHHLTSAACQDDGLQESDVDLIFGLLDYGTMSTLTVLADGTLGPIARDPILDLNLSTAGTSDIYDFGFGETGDIPEIFAPG